MNYQQELINFIAQIGRIPEKDIDIHLPVYNSGILSSLKLLELMAFIEKRFHIIIKPEELIEENFKDIQAILNFIQLKVGPVGVNN